MNQNNVRLNKDKFRMNKDTIRITNNIIKTYAFKISYTPDKNRITKHNIKTLSELLVTKKREYP